MFHIILCFKSTLVVENGRYRRLGLTLVSNRDFFSAVAHSNYTCKIYMSTGS